MAQMDQFKADGSIKIPNFNASNFAATRSTDEDILKNIRLVKEKYDYIVDPHTACGFQDLDLSSTQVILATAHPAKFPGEIQELLGINPDLPQSLKDIDERSGEPVLLSKNYGKFQKYLQQNMRVTD